MRQPFEELTNMKHPNWYYEHFNDVFTVNKQYDVEVEHITSIHSLKSKRVQEIGAGTGEHAQRILKKDPIHLELVDYDPKSIKILERRFCSDPVVRIQLADGFSDREWDCFDVVISMYSGILLNISDLQALNHRLDILLKRIAGSGLLIFEIVDCDVTMEMRKEGHTTILKESFNQKISVETSYSQNQMHLIYTGCLDNNDIYYRASLLSIDKKTMISILKNKAISDFGTVSLDKYGRRLLVYIKGSTTISH